jgi:hypothetical protein
MKLSSVAEAIASNEDEPVLAIRGTLTKLFKPMTGEGQYGAWSIQNGAIKDKTGEIKLCFSNREAVPDDWRGQVIELRCTKGQKGGWSGVKRTVNKKDKKEQLEITEKGDVILFDAEHEPEQPDGQEKAASRPQEPPQTSPRASTATEPPTTSKGRSEAELLADGLAAMYQIMNTQLAAITLVHTYLVPAVKERTGVQIDANQEAALVQNLLIQMYYQKSHWNFRQKAYPLEKDKAPPPPPPSD